MSAQMIVLVGHCGPDVFYMKNAIRRIVPDAEIKTVNEEKRLDAYLTKGTVLLVNRVLDGSFNGDGGVDLIGRVTTAADAPHAILVSNHADAQEAAVAAGAAPGFGKGQLYDEIAAERLRAVADAT